VLIGRDARRRSDWGRGQGGGERRADRTVVARMVSDELDREVPEKRDAGRENPTDLLARKLKNVS